jgi:hypothetical protein
MRPLLAVICVVGIIGGVEGYLIARDSWKVARPVHRDEAAPGVFAVDVTLAFDWTGEPDPFALDATTAAPLAVRLGSQTVVEQRSPVKAGEPVVVRPAAGLVVGRNELYLRVVPGSDSIGRPQAARLRVFRDETVIAETTFWSESGKPIEGRLAFELSSAPHADEHAH